MDAIWKMLVIIIMEPRVDCLADNLNRDKYPENNTADIEVNRKRVGLAVWAHS